MASLRHCSTTALRTLQKRPHQNVYSTTSNIDLALQSGSQLRNIDSAKFRRITAVQTCFQSKQWLSTDRSNDNGNGNNKNNNNPEETTIKITPSVETIDSANVSTEDVKLAMEAAALTEHDKQIDVRQQQQQPLSDVPGSEKGGKKLAIIYTCKVCDTRSAKKFTEQAYQNGLVMVRCPGCQNLHLIADNLGVFEDTSWNIETYLEKMGDRVVAVTDDNVLELTIRDVLGDKGLPGEHA